MATKLADIRIAVRGLFATLTGLDTVWVDEPRPITSDVTDGICLLSITSSVGQGRDETVQDQDLTQPLGEELADIYISNTFLVITAKIESANLLGGLSSLDYLEQARKRIQWKSSAAILHAVSTSWVECESPVPLTELRDDHQVSIWALDFRFFSRLVELDPARYPYLETVNGYSGTFTP